MQRVVSSETLPHAFRSAVVSRKPLGSIAPPSGGSSTSTSDVDDQAGGRERCGTGRKHEPERASTIVAVRHPVTDH